MLDNPASESHYTIVHSVSTRTLCYQEGVALQGLQPL